MIGIIDYGLGNVRAFANVYKNLGIPAVLVKEANELDRVSRAIIPGVGAFDHENQLVADMAMRGQRRPGLKAHEQAATLGCFVLPDLLHANTRARLDPRQFT